MQSHNTISTSLTTVPRSIRALAMMLALSAGGTLGATAALADDDKKETPKVDRIEGDFDQRIDQEPEVVQGQGLSSFTISNTWSQNGKSYTVTNRNGEISVKVDGDTLPADRWREKDGKLEILGKDGNVEASTDMPQMKDGGLRLQWGQPRAGNDASRRLAERLGEMMGNQQGMGQIAPLARPPVMLGINMTAVDDGVLVDRVLDGLPADKAGVREGDIITHVGGVKVSDTTDLVQALRDRKPGEKLDIVVLRDGKERTLTADLVAYDPQTIEVPGIARVPGMPEVPGLMEIPMLEDLPLMGLFPAQQNDVRAQLERLSEDLRAQARDLAKQHGDAAQALEQAKKALEDAAEQLSKARDQMNERRAQGNVWMAPGNQGDRQMFVFPEARNRAREEREGRRTRESRNQADDIGQLRDELRQLREEMKELRQKNEQERTDKP